MGKVMNNTAHTAKKIKETTKGFRTSGSLCNSGEVQ